MGKCQSARGGFVKKQTNCVPALVNRKKGEYNEKRDKINVFSCKGSVYYGAIPILFIAWPALGAALLPCIRGRRARGLAGYAAAAGVVGLASAPLAAWVAGGGGRGGAARGGGIPADSGQQLDAQLLAQGVEDGADQQAGEQALGHGPQSVDQVPLGGDDDVFAF